LSEPEPALYNYFFECSSGVPQGSVLGPLIYNIFINDIIEDLSVSCLLYADEMKIFSSIGEIGNCKNTYVSVRIDAILLLDSHKPFHWNVSHSKVYPNAIS
jgi:hypothetical protein